MLALISVLIFQPLSMPAAASEADDDETGDENGTHSPDDPVRNLVLWIMKAVGRMGTAVGSAE